MAVNFASGLAFPLAKSTCTRWSWLSFGTFVLFVAAAHAQTFQYSRGWTNGKRSSPATGSAATVGLVDLENGYLGPETSDLGLAFPGHIQFSLSPQTRLRTLDYNQYLARKFGMGSSGNLNTRKQPLWFGTIMGMDSADSSASSSQTSSGSSNSNPSGTSNDF